MWSLDDNIATFFLKKGVSVADYKNVRNNSNNTLKKDFNQTA